MAVYSYRTIEALASSLASISEMVFAKTPLVLGADEFVGAFVMPEHVPLLKHVDELCRPSVSSYGATAVQSAEGESVPLAISFTGRAPVLIPEYVRFGIQPTCPPEIKSKIGTWMAWRINFGEAFGDVLDAISYLNENCGDVEAMSLMLPCLPTIMANMSATSDDKATKRAQKLTSLKRFGKLPRLPRQVVSRLTEASALVNAATLMRDAESPATIRYDASFAVQRGYSPRRARIFSYDAAPASAVPIASFL